MDTQTHPLDGMLLPETLSLPRAFQDRHFSTEQLLHALGCDLEELWCGIVAGVIPPPARIPTANGHFDCWSVDLIKAWQADGCVYDPRVALHQQTVERELVQSVRDELPANPVKTTEVN